MMSDDLTDQLAALLERCGYSAEKARTLALEVRGKLARVEVGSIYGGLHAEVLPKLWEQASQGGDKRRLVLEITAEGDTYVEYVGHLRIEVKEAQTWADFEQERREAHDRPVN